MLTLGVRCPSEGYNRQNTIEYGGTESDTVGRHTRVVEHDDNIIRRYVDV